MPWRTDAVTGLPVRARPSPARLVSRGIAVPALAVAVLAWFGAPAWPRQIDDQLITLAFAHEWVETGLPRWSSGEVVEACSSFLQLAIATAWIALGGADANLFVKLLAAASGAALVAFAAWRMPRGPAGLIVLAALATWEPLGWWTFAGMETTLYALLLTVGWAGVLVPSGPAARLGPAAGVGALWLSATAHPEGNLHFALGAALTTLRGGPRERRAVLAAGLALVAWHALRVGYFGHVLPTPFLVKMAANDPFGRQWGQWSWELATAGGIGAVLLVAFPARPLALLPLLVQCLVELRAEADWMGHARHLVPGVCATAVAWTARARPRRLRRATLVGLLGLVGLAALLEPNHEGISVRDAGVLTTPTRWFGEALDTPTLEDIVWIIESAPWGGGVVLEDVGMPGNIEGVRIIDSVGLTHRDIALAWVEAEGADARVRAQLSGAGAPALVRRMKYGNDGFARPVPWVRLPVAVPVLYPHGTALRYRLTQARPTPDQIAARWAALWGRYPSQGPLTWHYALSEARRGHLVTAARVAATAARRNPADPMLEALPASLFAPFSLDTFDEGPSALRQISRPIPRDQAAGLALALVVEPPADDGQLVTVAWGCDRSPVATVRVYNPTVVPLPAWACEGDTARIRVEALDGRPNRPLARRVSVGLTVLD